MSAQLKHRVQLNRIERKIRSMKLDSGSSARRDVLSASWDFISMGELLTLDKDAIEEVNSQMRMYKSSLLVPPDAERRPLDRQAILAAGDRLEEQVQQELKRKVVRVETRTNIRQKRREKEVHEERAALEKKVQAAILSVLAPSIVENEAPVTVKLKTRDILPSYTINDVNDFITLIAQVNACTYCTSPLLNNFYAV